MTSATAADISTVYSLNRYTAPTASIAADMMNIRISFSELRNIMTNST